MAETKKAVKEEVVIEKKAPAITTVFDGLHSKTSPKPDNGKFSTKATRGTLDKR